MKRETLMRMMGTLTAALLSAAPGRSGFSDGLSSAAADGSGNAVVARSPEAGSLFVNPGVLGRLDQGDLSLMYAKPLTGIPDVSVQQGVAAVAVPVGTAWTLAGGARYFDDAGLSKETEASVGAAVKLGLMSVGAAGVFLQRSFDVGSIPGASSDPVFSKGTSKSGIGIDAGAQYQAMEDLSLGAAARNLNQPDLGLAGVDKVPMTWRAGAAYKWNAFTFLGEVRGRSAATSADAKWGAGVEWRVMSPLVLRAGGDDKEVSAGVGLNFRDMRLDYAFSFLQSLGAGEAANHRISIGYKFGELRGEAPARPAYAKPVKKAIKAPVKAKPAARATGQGMSTEDSRAYPNTFKKTSKKRIHAWD